MGTNDLQKGKKISRLSFLKITGSTMALAAVQPFLSTAHMQENVQSQPTWSSSHAVSSYDSSKPNVYFTRDLDSEGVKKIYQKVNQNMTGKIAIKLSTVEPHGLNILPREYIKELQSSIPNSNIVECNVYYKSPRQQTETHREVIKINGFDFCKVDIMDEDGDVIIPIKNMHKFLNQDNYPNGNYPYVPGMHLEEIAVGKHMLNYDSMLVYTHFKGHPMAGFGGSLKNIGIGCASGAIGKRQIHGDGWPTGEPFLERMVESGKGITDHFGKRITYVNVLKNISVDCDCVAHPAPPTCNDIGILGSTDILAADQAGIDLIYQMVANQRHDIVERIESRHGLHQLDYMEILGMGSREYNLIEI